MSIFGAMKKIFLAFVLLAGASLLTGCLKDNYDGTETTYQVTRGALVLNAGSPGDNIDGSLSYISFGDNSITPYLFCSFRFRR